VTAGSVPPAGQERPPELGPDAISVLDGSTFMVSDARGDVPEGAVAGLFHDDTRFLSRFELRLGGRTPELLTSSTVDYYSAAFFLASPELEGTDGSRVPAHALTVVRSRFVGDGLREGIEVRNHLDRPVAVELRLRCGADFADIFEVRDRVRAVRGERTRSHDEERCVLGFAYGHRAFRAASRIHSSAPARIEGDDFVFDVRLEPRGRWRTEVRVVVHLDEAVSEPVHEAFGEAAREPGRVLAKWRDEVPRLRADLDLLEHVYRRSIVDLAALRLCAEVEGNEYSLPAAGLPWFMAIFGRDTLITSYQALWVGPDLALGALRALAALQGTVEDDFRDEEPGKILHEIRFGELSALGLKPHRPYYGTADATPLWLILLSEYRRWTGDDGTVRELEPNARRALEWIDRFGDRDGDGYVEYATRSPEGLANQGWKDSWDGVRFADGRLPEPPIAIAEVQGYVYDAKGRAAELAAEVWGDPDLAARLRREAEELRERFSRDFWTDARGGYYVVGLDREKRRIDSMTSNMGHLLWSGIVPEDRAAAVARQLLSPPMFSGWGIRTLSEEDAAYTPIGYHTGSVWPHDNSIAAAGLARYGLREEANRVAMAMLEAAGFTGHRLPEVFAGYARGDAPFPVRYPTACNPQAWATAAPFLFLRTMLGLEAEGGALRCGPQLPPEVGRVFIHGLHAFGTHVDVEAEGTSARITPTR
jgi:glycogen debranching enzyme